MGIPPLKDSREVGGPQVDSKKLGVRRMMVRVMKGETAVKRHPDSRSHRLFDGSAESA